MNERRPERPPGELPPLSARDLARASIANGLFENLQNVRMMVEQNLADESLYKSALSEYRREMKNSGLQDMIRVLPPLDLSKKEASRPPELRVDKARRIVDLGDQTRAVDDMTIEALELLSSGEMVESRELREVATKYGARGSYPTKMVLNRLEALLKDNPNIFEDFDRPGGRLYRLKAQVLFVEGIEEMHKPKPEKTKPERKPKQIEEKKEKKDPQIPEGKIQALRKLLLESNPNDEEIIDLLGLTVAGRKFTRPQAASSLINTVRYLLIRKSRDLLSPHELDLFESLSERYNDETGRFFDKTGDRIATWRSQGKIKPATENKPEDNNELELSDEEAGLLAILIMGRSRTAVLSSAGEDLFNFSIPVEVMNSARKIADDSSRKRSRLKGPEVITLRNQAIEEVSKLIKEGTDDRVPRDGDISVLIGWLWKFAQDEQILRDNFSNFLKTFVNSTNPDRKYLVLKTNVIIEKTEKSEIGHLEQPSNEPQDHVGSEIKDIKLEEPILTLQDDVVPELEDSSDPEPELPVTTGPESIQSEAALEESLKAELAEIAARTNRTPAPDESMYSKLPEQKSPWAEFEKRDPKIRTRILAILEEVLAKNQEMFPGSRLVGEFVGVTDRLEDIAIKNEIVKPDEWRKENPIFGITESVKFIYYCRFGRSIGLRSKDYKKFSTLIEPELQKARSAKNYSGK